MEKDPDLVKKRVGEENCGLFTTKKKLFHSVEINIEIQQYLAYRCLWTSYDKFAHSNSVIIKCKNFYSILVIITTNSKKKKEIPLHQEVQ